MFRAVLKSILTGRPPSLDLLLEGADAHGHPSPSTVYPAPTSNARTPFESGLPREQISMMNLNAAQKRQVARRMVPLMWNMRLGVALYDRPVRPTQQEATPEFLAGLGALARELGAKDFAYVQVPQDAVFKDKSIPCDTALVFTVEMDQDAIDTAPSLDCQLEVMDGYGRMAFIARKLALHLRAAGFAAYPGTALGGVTDYPQLAELAGLGAIGYHGLLITPGEGARVRLNTVYTNISNLPIPQQNEHLWVRDFCDRCRKCVRSCPAEAIFQQPQARGNGGQQCIDHGKCRDYFTQNFGCAVCVKVCPFSQAGYDRVKAGFKGHDGALQYRISPGAEFPGAELEAHHER